MEKSFKKNELPVPGTVPILDRPSARDTPSKDMKITKHTVFGNYVCVRYVNLYGIERLNFTKPAFCLCGEQSL
jgi:hypothetical protein